MEKILTVIIPTYNMEKYLDKCLTSLIINNWELMKQLEVLVIIDGAKDRSSEIAHTYQDNYPETFRVIDKENGNYGSCINRGLKEASGVFVKILDADDSFNNSALEGFLLYLLSMKNKSIDLVISDYLTEDDNGNIIKSFTNNVPVKEDITIQDIDALSFTMHMVTYSLEMLRKIEYFQTEGISYTDQEWIFEPMLNVRKISYYDKDIIYKYLVGRDGQTVSQTSLVKNLDHQISGIVAQFNALSKYDQLSSGISHYIHERLAWRLENIYSIGLLHTNYFNNELMELDKKYVINNEEYKLITNKFKSKGLKYVKIWRFFGYRPFPSFIVNK